MDCEQPDPPLVAFTIRGELASKANSREIVLFGKRAASIKSEKARNYERTALMQIPPEARLRLEGEIAVTLRIFYASERPDLDESILLDVLQDRYSKPSKAKRVMPGGQQRMLISRGVYRNDRQVREKHVYHAIDRANPRAEIEIRLRAGVARQLDLAVDAPPEEADECPF